jgi:hypothetical protein
MGIFPPFWPFASMGFSSMGEHQNIKATKYLRKCHHTAPLKRNDALLLLALPLNVTTISLECIELLPCIAGWRWYECRRCHDDGPRTLTRLGCNLTFRIYIYPNNVIAHRVLVSFRVRQLEEQLKILRHIITFQLEHNRETIIVLIQDSALKYYGESICICR